jgi:hypothetical protein
MSILSFGENVTVLGEGSDRSFTHFNTIRLLKAGGKRTIQLSLFGGGSTTLRRIRRRLLLCPTDAFCGKGLQCAVSRLSGCGATTQVKHLSAAGLAAQQRCEVGDRLYGNISLEPEFLGNVGGTALDPKCP